MPVPLAPHTTERDRGARTIAATLRGFTFCNVVRIGAE